MSRLTRAQAHAAAVDNHQRARIEDRMATASGRLELAKLMMLRLYQAERRHDDLHDLLEPVAQFCELYGVQAAVDLEAAQAAYRELERGRRMDEMEF